MTKRKFIVVVGRITFDDEDSAYEFQNMTKDEAVTKFKERLWEDEGVEPGDNDRTVLDSESPIWMERYT